MPPKTLALILIAVILAAGLTVFAITGGGLPAPIVVIGAVTLALILRLVTRHKTP